MSQTDDRSHWNPHVRRAYDYWQAIRPAADLLPGRQHFSPAEIVDILPTVWLMDVQREPLRLKYRLLGTTIVRLSGQDPTGKWVDEAHPGSSTDAEGVPDVVNKAVPHWRRGKSSMTLTHKDFIEIERVLLPLARDGRTVDMIFACSAFYTSDGRAI